MDFIDKQIPPPKSWEKFEDLTRALFAAVWKWPLTQKNGRSGQNQHGVDVFGTLEAGKTFGVQCKGKNQNYGAKASITEFDTELAKAEKFNPTLGHWTFATTASNDAPLQEHARLVSERRVKEGKFPVDVIGWETIQAMLSNHQEVAEEFYSEYAGDLPQIMAALRALPKAAEINQLRQSLMALVPPSAPANLTEESSVWAEVKFETARDLGSALMGRPLGPADVAACPTLPEVGLLIADLERAGSARLTGMPGAGKSISILQVARQMHDRGWQVLRLADSMGRIPHFDESLRPTLYVVDDAHLTRPALLRELEEHATASRWVLSAYTIIDDKGGLPGAIQLDAKRAVRVIADGLRASPETTLAAVRRADDRVGDHPGDERLDLRLDHAAEQALYPWQFCFILGGGWRRASALASSARAAEADLVLAAAAIRQLATRDARCSRNALMQLIGVALPTKDCGPAISWLVAQRLLLSVDDLRCPHQRLASVLLERILDGQSAEGRKTIACMLREVLGDEEMSLGGLGVLLSELSMAGEFRQWRQLVQAIWLTPVLARCWVVREPLDIRDACWVLSKLHGYSPNEMAEISNHKETLASWIEAAPEGACYAIGRLINHVFNSDEVLGENIIELVDPCILASAISSAGSLHAGEIANMISMMRAIRNDEWKIRYLESIDRNACFHLMSTWPKDAFLSVAADFCEHFCSFDPEFGFMLIEALIPAIADRIRTDPQDSFHELNDIVWNSLRLYDPLDIYVGKKSPSRRMRQVGRKICACWSPKDLATKLSRSTHRSFQSAAGLLSFMEKSSPKQFEETVLALNWDDIDQAIGDDWAEWIGDARMLLGVAYTVDKARPAIHAMVERNESRIVNMSAHLAALAPASALRHVAAGKHIALCRWGHVDWSLGAFILATFVRSAPTLVPGFLDSQYRGLAKALSQHSPSFYKDALTFIRLLVQIDPSYIARILDHIHVETAEIGWRNALRGQEKSHEPGAKAQSQQVASLLIHHALGRHDSIGELARQLRCEFPRQSVPLAKTIELIDLTE